MLKSVRALIALVFAGLGFTLAMPAAAFNPDEIIFQLKSNYPKPLEVRFFSMASEKVWPGRNESYRLEGDFPDWIPVPCEGYERICFGAWVEDGDFLYQWGAGMDGDRDCETCCARCAIEPISDIITLE